MPKSTKKFTYTKVYLQATDTENLKYFCGLALSGKFNKVVKARDQKSAQHSTLSEFGLETLPHSINNFSAIKARRETKFDDYIEEIHTDISTKQLV